MSFFIYQAPDFSNHLCACFGRQQGRGLEKLDFGVGRGVVREAIKTLADEGRLDLDAPVGEYVADLVAPGSSQPRVAAATRVPLIEAVKAGNADAVRARIDWKYLLGLELTDPGFDHSVLCEFRSRLLEGSAEELG